MSNAPLRPEPFTPEMAPAALKDLRAPYPVRPSVSGGAS